MLVCASDCGVHRYIPFDQARTIRVLLEALLRSVPDSVVSHAFMPLPHRLPRPEGIGQITPWDSAPVSVDDAFNHQSGISERATLLSSRAWHQIGDQSPLIIREELES